MVEVRGIAIRWILILAVLLGPALAQEQPTSLALPSHAVLWVDDSATVTSEMLGQTLLEVSQQENEPQQIVVMLHGYDMGPEESSGHYRRLTEQVRRGLSPDRVALVGLQWASGGNSLLNPAGDYFNTLRRARAVGRGPLRELLLALQESHPGVPITLLAHSMGCEIAVAAVVPEIGYGEHAPEGEAFEPEREIPIALAAFVGSDLDYDFWHKSGAAGLKWFDRCQLTWATVSDPTAVADRVLSMRARIRGKAAGALFPRMTEEQLDKVIPLRRFYLDGRQVPSNHALDAYFDDSRLARILAALKFLTQPGAPEPEELEATRTVLELADEPRFLLPYLDSPYAGAAFTALWRLEYLNCGSSRHLADQTLEEAVLLLPDRAKAIWPLQARSECVTLRKGQFPTAATMTKAGAPPRSRPPRWSPQR